MGKSISFCHWHQKSLSRVHICLNRDDLGEVLRPMLDNELLCLAQDFPTRVLTAGEIVFSSIPSAFDTLESNFSRRLVIDPSQSPHDSPTTRYRTQTSDTCVFTILGLVSGIDCLAEQTEPHCWGDVSIPNVLLMSLWPSGISQASSRIIIPGVRIVGTQIRGCLFSAVNSCTMARDLCDFKSVSHVIHTQEANGMSHSVLKIEPSPRFGDRGAWLRACSLANPDKIFKLTVLSDCLIKVAVKSGDTYLNPANGQTM